MRSGGNTHPIGEVAHRAGVQASAIRYYERIGLLPEPERTGGKRRYSGSVLDRLAVIQLAKQAGFSLAEIRILLNGFSADMPPSARWRELARKKIPEVEDVIKRARGMQRLLEEGLTCECLSIEQCGVLLRK